MNGHMIVRLFRAASLIILLIAVGLLSAITTMHFAIHGSEVRVPSLKGMTIAEARSQTSGMGLNLTVDNRYYSGDVAAGHILSQSPEPGTVVRREWRVRIAESLGPQKVDVPNTVDRDQRVAALELRRVGLDVGTVAHLPDGSVSEGTVIAQYPPPHAQGIEGPAVSLLVAAPEETTADGYVMPDFTGVPVVAAQAALAKVGLKTATPIFVDAPVPAESNGQSAPAAPVAPGSVIAQQPPPGARVDQNMEVSLTVAK